jgi:hypothetical protein
MSDMFRDNMVIQIGRNKMGVSGCAGFRRVLYCAVLAAAPRFLVPCGKGKPVRMVNKWDKPAKWEKTKGFLELLLEWNSNRKTGFSGSAFTV